MAICKVCGNDYPYSFEIVRDGQSATYDCFECAIHDFAPTCAHCQCRVIGHGIAAGAEIFCCAHCARQRGVTNVADSTGKSPKPHHAPFI
jgi:sulfur relay (sulfurtransferase) complex TusBCD TusD component (DsrE family)